jgi:hypothetical protein
MLLSLVSSSYLHEMTIQTNTSISNVPNDDLPSADYFVDSLFEKYSSKKENFSFLTLEGKFNKSLFNRVIFIYIYILFSSDLRF